MNDGKKRSDIELLENDYWAHPRHVWTGTRVPITCGSENEESRCEVVRDGSIMFCQHCREYLRAKYGDPDKIDVWDHTIYPRPKYIWLSTIQPVECPERPGLGCEVAHDGSVMYCQPCYHSVMEDADH